jgi:transcription elongation factor Elf1
MHLSELTEERLIHCPYCGDAFTVIVDCSAGSQTYLEDCAVCCRTIRFEAMIDGAEGFLLHLQLHREDD